MVEEEKEWMGWHKAQDAVFRGFKTARGKGLICEVPVMVWVGHVLMDWSIYGWTMRVLRALGQTHWWDHMNKLGMAGGHDSRQDVCEALSCLGSFLSVCLIPFLFLAAMILASRLYYPLSTMMPCLSKVSFRNLPQQWSLTNMGIRAETGHIGEDSCLLCDVCWRKTNHDICYEQPSRLHSEDLMVMGERQCNEWILTVKMMEQIPTKTGNLWPRSMVGAMKRNY